MTMVPMYKTCLRCKRKYSWNPDVGNMWCPRCGISGGIGEEKKPKKLGDILKRKWK